MDIMIGVEQELTVIDESGKVMAFPNPLLATSDPQLGPLFSAECSDHQIELNSNAAAGLEDLVQDQVARWIRTRTELDEWGLRLAPISPTQISTSRYVPEKLKRTQVYLAIFGENSARVMLSHNGVHNHVDLIPDQAVAQYNVQQALSVALYAICASSLVSLYGENGLVTRIRDYRARDLHSKQGAFAKLPEDNPYIKSLGDLQQQDESRFNLWAQEFARNRPESLAPDYFRAHFQPDNTGFTLVRRRPNIGKNGTLEGRGPDTTTAKYLITEAAINLGIQRRLANERPDVIVAYNGTPYEFTGKRIILPTQYHLEQLRANARLSDLKDEGVQAFVYELAKYALDGLTREERRFVPSAQEIATTNFNTQIEGYLQSQGLDRVSQLSQGDRQKLHLFANQKQEEDIAYLQSLARPHKTQSIAA